MKLLTKHGKPRAESVFVPPRADKHSTETVQRISLKATSSALWEGQAAVQCSPHRVAVLQEEELLRHNKLSVLVFHNQVPQQPRQDICPGKTSQQQNVRKPWRYCHAVSTPMEFCQQLIAKKSKLGITKTPLNIKSQSVIFFIPCHSPELYRIAQVLPKGEQSGCSFIPTHT